MSSDSGIRLVFSDGRPGLDDLEAVNEAVRGLGALFLPLALDGLSPEARRLLTRPRLSETDKRLLMDERLLSRSAFLDVVTRAGREPWLPDGGSMETRVTNHGYDYPQLYVAEPVEDWSRFDRLHVNVAEDGTGVDEVAQILCGAGVETVLEAPDRTRMTIHYSCPSPDCGWIVTYDGARPHITSLSRATPGTKVLVQVVGAPRWRMEYVDSAEGVD